MVLDGQNLGVVSTTEAKSLAYDKGLDLVEVNANAKPPVCQIIDNSKFRYQQAKKQKQNKQKKLERKEVRLSPGTGDHDIDTKVRQARKFLEQGKPVKVTVRYKKRQIAHVDEGQRVMDKMLEALQDFGKPDHRPRLEGKQLSVQVNPHTQSQ